MPSLDQNRVTWLRGIMPAKDFPRFVDLLRQDLTERRNNLSAAMAAGDRGAIQMEAHAIAGMAANTGACTLEKMARALMKESGASPLPELTEAMVGVLAEEETVQRELAALL